MNESSEIEQQLWELVYGLLSEEETRELQQRIRSDRQLARKYAEICLQADLVANASKLPAPPAELSVSAIDPTAKPTAKSSSSNKKPAPSASVSQKSKVQPWIDRGLLVLAASLLLLMVGVGPQALKKIDTESVAFHYPHIKMTTDRPMIEAISSQLKVTLSDATGKPLSLPTRAQVVTPMGEVTNIPVNPGRDLGELSLPLARNVVVPGSKLQVQVDGLPKQEVPLPIQSNPVEDVVVLEKSVVSPGETLHFFAYGRHAIGGEITKPSADSIRLFGISEAKDAKQAADPMFEVPAENERKFLRDGEVVKGEITIPKETALGLAAVSLEKSGLPVAEQPVLIVAADEQQLASSGSKASAQSLALNTQRKAGESLERFHLEGMAKKSMTAPMVRSQPEAGAAAPPPPRPAEFPLPASDASKGRPDAPSGLARGALPPGAPSPSALGAMPPSGGSRSKEDALASSESASGKENAQRRVAKAKGGAIAGIPGAGGPASGQLGMKSQSQLEKESSGELAKSNQERASGGQPADNDQLDRAPAGSGLGGLGGGAGNRAFDTEEKLLAQSPMTGRWLRRGSDANVVLPVPEALANPANPVQVDIRSGNDVIASQFFDATQIQDGNISIPVPAEVPPPLTAQFFGSNASNRFTVDVPSSLSSTLDRIQIAGSQEVYQPGQSVEMTIEPPAGEGKDFEVLGVQVVQTELLTDVFRFSGSDTQVANSGSLRNRNAISEKRLNNSLSELPAKNDGAFAKMEKSSGTGGREANALGDKTQQDPSKQYTDASAARDSVADELSIAAQSPVLLWDNSGETTRNFQSEVDQLTRRQSSFRKLFNLGILGLAVVVLGLVASRVLKTATASKPHSASRTSPTSAHAWTARQYWSATAAMAAVVLAMVIWWPNGPLSHKTAMHGVGSATPEAQSMPPGMPPPMAPATKPNSTSGEVQDFVAEERHATAKREIEALKETAPPRERTELNSEKPASEPLTADAPSPAMDDATDQGGDPAPQQDERKSKLQEKVAIPLSLFWMTPDPMSGSERIPIRFTLPEAEADYTLIVHAVENGQPVTKQVPIVIRHPALAKEAVPTEPEPAGPAPASEPKPAPPQPK